MAETRLGRVSYINVDPIYAGLDALGSPYRVVPGVPTLLNRMLLENRLDCAPGSAIELAAQPGRYTFCPGVCVASDGPVGSALLLSDCDPRELGGRTVALTSHSASTVALFRILCRDLWQVEPVLSVFSTREESERADASVLIGDPALRSQATGGAALADAVDAPFVVDLGAAWQTLTGLPMVFAVWLVRRDWAAQCPADAAQLASWLERALAWSAQPSNLELVARAAAPRVGLPLETVTAYFALQRYELTRERLAGLAEFHRRAALLGIVPGPVPLEPMRAEAFAG
ncbi:MAG: menaquinone biosynthesis protein [Candidatus Dormibacteria bacterium]